jgi:hypothetical protein
MSKRRLSFDREISADATGEEEEIRGLERARIAASDLQAYKRFFVQFDITDNYVQILIFVLPSFEFKSILAIFIPRQSYAVRPAKGVQ